MSDQQPFDDEQAVAAVAAEEVARARALRQSGSTTIIARRQPPPRSLWPLIALALPLIAALIAVVLLVARSPLERERRTPPNPTTARNPTTPPRPAPSADVPTPVPPSTPAAPIVSEPVEAALIAPTTRRTPAISITDAPEPLTSVTPVTASPTEVAATASEPISNAASNRQRQERAARLDQGIDLLTRDLAEREQVIASTRRRLTFLPEGQPPLGVREQLAEAQRHWEGANASERDRIAGEIASWQADIRNLERTLAHHEEIAESLRRRLQTAREQRAALDNGK